MEKDLIHLGDSRNMDKIDDNSVHLTFTSPPYYVGKKYEDYLKTFEEYIRMLCDVFSEVVRVTVPGGKIVINIGDIASGSRFNDGIPEEVMVIPKLVDFLRSKECYLYARIVWEKDDPWANSNHVTFHNKVVHGEYRVLPAWEYIFVFRKGKEQRRDKAASDGRYVSKEEWRDWVHGVWKIRSVSRNDFHEAMFPTELVRRVVKMYSFPGDTVLDCFSGSGTVALVSRKLGRHYLGYELDKGYWKLANELLSQDELLFESTDPIDDSGEKSSDQLDIFS